MLYDLETFAEAPGGVAPLVGEPPREADGWQHEPGAFSEGPADDPGV